MNVHIIILRGKVNHDSNPFAEDKNILLVEVFMWFIVIWIIFKCHYSHKLERKDYVKMEISITIIMQKKPAFFIKRGKIWNKTKFTFVLDYYKKMYSFAPILTPQIPTPLDCQLPFRNPREPIFQWPLISLLWDTIHWTELFSICQRYFLALQVTTFSFDSHHEFLNSFLAILEKCYLPEI